MSDLHLRARLLRGDYGGGIDTLISGALFGSTICYACGADGPPLRCGRCRIPAYCGRECQRAHWPDHKIECAKLEISDSMKAEVPGITRVLDRMRELERGHCARHVAERTHAISDILRLHGTDAAKTELARLSEADIAPAALEENHARATKHLIAAALECGELNLAIDYAIDSLDTEGDVAVAVSALEVLAEDGQTIAAHALAHCALEGRGMVKDRGRGLALLEVAASVEGAAGARARCDLAACLMEGDDANEDSSDFEHDPTFVRAFNLLSSSVVASNDAVHFFRLSEAHLHGRGTVVDVVAGAAALLESANRGFDIALADMAAFYKRGIGVPKDAVKARDARGRCRLLGLTQDGRHGPRYALVKCT